MYLVPNHLLETLTHLVFEEEGDKPHYSYTDKVPDPWKIA